MFGPCKIRFSWARRMSTVDCLCADAITHDRPRGWFPCASGDLGDLEGLEDTAGPSRETPLPLLEFPPVDEAEDDFDFPAPSTSGGTGVRPRISSLDSAASRQQERE